MSDPLWDAAEKLREASEHMKIVRDWLVGQGIEVTYDANRRAISVATVEDYAAILGQWADGDPRTDTGQRMSLGHGLWLTDYRPPSVLDVLRHAIAQAVENGGRAAEVWISTADMAQLREQLISRAQFARRSHGFSVLEVYGVRVMSSAAVADGEPVVRLSAHP